MAVAVELEPGLYPVSMRFDYTLPLRSFYGINPAIIPDITTKTVNQVDALVELRGNTLVLCSFSTAATASASYTPSAAAFWSSTFVSATSIPIQGSLPISPTPLRYFTFSTGTTTTAGPSCLVTTVSAPSLVLTLH